MFLQLVQSGKADISQECGSRIALLFIVFYFIALLPAHNNTTEHSLKFSDTCQVVIGIPYKKVSLWCYIGFSEYTLNSETRPGQSVPNFWMNKKNIFSGDNIFLVKKLPWVRKVYHGVRKGYHGVKKVYHGVRKVYHGVMKVNHGVRKVYHGVRKVYHGDEQIYHGVRKVYHGARKVYHGVRKVYHGIRKAYHEGFWK